MIISKELLSLVLGKKIGEHTYIEDSTNSIWYGDATMYSATSMSNQLNLDSLGRLVREKLRSMNYVTTMTIHVDTVAISLSQDGKQVYSTKPMTTRSELECSIEALDYATRR